MSRNHGRRTIDYSKGVSLVDNIEEFMNQDTDVPENANGGTMSVEKKKPGSDNVGPKKKENIIIPVTKKVEDPLLMISDERIVKKRKHQSQYIRMSYIVNVPNPDDYEITDRDIEFLKEVNDKMVKTNKNNPPFSHELFEKLITLWENETGREDNPITLLKAQTAADALLAPSQKETVAELYTYWVKLRDKYKRPMLRKFLKVINKDETNPNAAFRTRENPKMKTRRAQKANDQEGLEKMKSLKEDMDCAITLYGNVKYRELIKLELFELSLLKFESAIKDKNDPACVEMTKKFKENYENEKYLGTKSKLKEYNKKAQNLIAQFREANLKHQAPVETSYVQKPVQSSRVNSMRNSLPKEDMSHDLGCFIASITEEAYERGITVEKIQNLDVGTAADTNIQPPLIQNDRMMMEESKRNDLTRVRSQPAPTVPGQIEEKNIFKYKLRKRYDRFGRVVLEKIFEEDDSDFTIHHKDYFEKQFEPNTKVLTSEVLDKLHNGKGTSKDTAREFEPIQELYVERFSGFAEIYPFGDSEDDQDLQEFSKQIKRNLQQNFKNFLRQKKSVYPPTEGVTTRG